MFKRSKTFKAIYEMTLTELNEFSIIHNQAIIFDNKNGIKIMTILHIGTRC